jgi:hypothetical protein
MAICKQSVLKWQMQWAQMQWAQMQWAQMQMQAKSSDIN